MRNKSERIVYLSILLQFIIMVFFLPTKCYEGDMAFWNNWAKHIFSDGLSSVYNFTDVNYHPIFLYFLWFFTLFHDSVKSIDHSIYLIKIVPLLFDFLSFIPIVIITKKFGISIYKALFLFFNVAYFYNSYYWGQVDSIFTTFALYSLVFALREKPFVSILFMLLAVNTKMQAIVFIPIVMLILLNNSSIKVLVKYFIYVVLLQSILILPFLISDTAQKIVYVVTGAVGFYPVISMNAFNIWTWIFPHHKNLLIIMDGISNGYFTARQLGKYLFLIGSFLSLFPLFFTVFRRKFSVENKNTWELVFLISTLIPLVFFFFNTQMHERYSHPIIIFSFIYALLSNKYDMYILSSVAYFLNMEYVLHYFNMEYQTLIFEPRFVALVFGLVLIIGFYRLFCLTKLILKFSNNSVNPNHK